MAVSSFYNTEDLIKDNEISRTDLQDLREFLLEENLAKLSDEQIIIFLLSCDKNIDFTKETIRAHYKIKKDYPKYFTNRSIDRPDIHFHINNCVYVFKQTLLHFIKN